MKRHLFLIFWTLGILMPMAWLVRSSPAASPVPYEKQAARDNGCPQDTEGNPAYTVTHVLCQPFVRQINDCHHP